MSDVDAVKRVAAAAAALVPPLTDRLDRHALGEIEIQHGDVRVRVASARLPANAQSGSHPAGPGAAARSPQEPRRPDGSILRSPAVGYFVAHDGLAVGQAVVAGANVGHVDMLGVRHDVQVDTAGTVRRMVVEDGQAVEFGQELLEIGSGGS